MYGIDLDGVIIESEPMIVKYVENAIGEKFTPPTPRVFDFQCGFEYKFSPGELYKLVTDAINEHGMHFPMCDRLRTLAGLHNISAKYGTIHFITARPESNRDVTYNWLSDNLEGLEFELHMVDSKPKIEVMNELGIDILIDDRLKTVIQVSKTNIVGMVYRPWNSGRAYKNHRVFRGVDFYSVYHQIEAHLKYIQ
jgi:uncharacterized HAD superfamily protein